jgi:antitoxin CptB
LPPGGIEPVAGRIFNDDHEEAGKLAPLLLARSGRYRIGMASDLDTKRKQALFRAQRRGFRELDLLFAAFADKYLNALDEQQLETFEALLAVPDWQLYGWIMGNEAVPKPYDTDLFALLCDYKGPAFIR